MEEINFTRLDKKSVKSIGNITIDDEVYTIDKLKKFVKDDSNYVFVGRDNNKVVAFIYAYGLDRPDGRKMFYIHAVDVIEDYQSKGIGTRLMKYVLDYIKSENKYYKFWVLADSDNIKAIKLYKKSANSKDQVLFENKI